MALILDLETWSRITNARNLSVHDYLGISDEDFFVTMGDFLKELEKLKG